MQTVTIREVQHNLSAWLQVVEAGEEIEIRRRNKPVAHLVPAISRARKVDWSFAAERRRRIWDGRKTPGTPIETVVAEGRGDR